MNKYKYLEVVEIATDKVIIRTDITSQTTLTGEVDIDTELYYLNERHTSRLLAIKS